MRDFLNLKLPFVFFADQKKIIKQTRVTPGGFCKNFPYEFFKKCSLDGATINIEWSVPNSRGCEEAETKTLLQLTVSQTLRTNFKCVHHLVVHLKHLEQTLVKMSAPKQ